MLYLFVMVCDTTSELFVPRDPFAVRARNPTPVPLRAILPNEFVTTPPVQRIPSPVPPPNPNEFITAIDALIPWLVMEVPVLLFTVVATMPVPMTESPWLLFVVVASIPIPLLEVP